MNEPDISIVIPVYNREELILQTLESVRIQTLSNWECIIVDDYSIDNSIEVIKRFISDDKRFRLIQKSQQVKGAPNSRNIGWQNARSNYIMFLDSDDLLTPIALQKRVDHLNANRTLDFNLSSNVEFKEDALHKLSRAKFQTENPLNSFLSFNAVWQTSSPTWKKNFLIKINGWDEEALSWQDGEIHIRALILNPQFKWIDVIPNIFIRTTNSGSISYQKSLKKYINNVVIFEKIYNTLEGEHKSIFQKHIQIWVYNLIENLSISDSLEFLKSINCNTFKLSKNKTITYIFLFHYASRIIGLRSLFYRIRNSTSLFPKRKKFFEKSEISINTVNELKKELSEIDLFTNIIPWLNE